MGKVDDCSSFTNTNLRCPEHLETPIAVSEIPIAVSEIPVAVSETLSAVILLGTCETISDVRMDAMVMMGISIAKYSW
jgi:hypothetical protein